MNLIRVFVFYTFPPPPKKNKNCRKRGLPTQKSIENGLKQLSRHHRSVEKKQDLQLSINWTMVSVFHKPPPPPPSYLNGSIRLETDSSKRGFLSSLASRHWRCERDNKIFENIVNSLVSDHPWCSTD